MTTSLPRDHVSASQLRAFSGYYGCELSYYFRYVEEIKEGPKGMGLLVGNAWDKMANHAADHKIETGKNPDPDDVVGAFVEGWDKEVALDEYVDDDDSGPALRDRGERAARRFAEVVVPRLKPRFTQRRTALEFEGIDWKLVGWVDLGHDMEGGLVPLDNKTTSNPRKQYDAATAAKDLQLRLYDVSLTHEGETVVGRGFLSARFLKTKQELGAAVVASTEADRQTTLDLLGAMTLRMEDAYRQGNFLPTAMLADSPKCQAKFCGYWETVCPYGRRAQTHTSLAGLEIPPSPQERAIERKQMTAEQKLMAQVFEEAFEGDK